MKILILLLALISCGKKIDRNSDPLLLMSPATDSDGDGVSDITEITLGRNHLIAEINTNNNVKDNNLVLVDGVLKEYSFSIAPRRRLREQLLRKLIGIHEGGISDINELTIDFNSNQDFWKIYHQGVNFYQYYFKYDKSKTYSLPVRFDENRNFKIDNFSDYGILENVKKSTYRLIISSDENEIIHYVHPSVSLISFMETEYGAHFNNNGITKINGLASSSIYDQNRWDYVTDSHLPMSSPEAGKTYAFVYSNLSQLQASTLASGKMNWNNNISTPFNQRIEKTIFVPSIYKRDTGVNISSGFDVVGEMEIYWEVSENIDLGFKPYSPSVEQIKTWFNQDVLQDLTVLWSFSSQRGTTFRFSGFMAKSDNAPLLNKTIENSEVVLGITRSTHYYTKPNAQAHSLYTGHKEYYLAD